MRQGRDSSEHRGGPHHGNAATSPMSIDYGANFDLIHQAPSSLYLQMSSKQKELIPNCLYLQIALLFKSVKQFKRGRKF